ncbi:MAG: hypothetical protein WAN11_26505 [Syntrophobacteraceae bacterium]
MKFDPASLPKRNQVHVQGMSHEGSDDIQQVDSAAKPENFVRILDKKLSVIV